MQACKYMVCVIAYDYVSGNILDSSGAIPYSLVPDIMKEFQKMYDCRLAVVQCSAQNLDN